MREAAEKLSKRRQETESLQEKFEDIESIPTGNTVKEGFLTKEIGKTAPEKVAGIDGGIQKRRYSMGDVVLVRAVAAVFSFSDGRIKSSEYIPGKSPEPEFHVLDSEDSQGLEEKAESLRVKEESSKAVEALGKAETVLMDGSVVPSYLREDEGLQNYSELFEKAGKGQLVGVVEDSHGGKQTSLLEKKLGIELGKRRDTAVMDAVLSEGERSFVRKYSDSPVEHPVLQKLDEKEVNRIHTFYVKLSEDDRPLRIDFYGNENDADRIASTLNFLKASKRYTVPTPIIEADKRAKIPDKHIQRLENRFSPMRRRRDRRSF